MTGPFPNDTLFYHALAGAYDAVVAMYHDQGHIALKTIGFDRAVNVTLGLPIVRTSVAHGTAFDIAWKGLADPSSLIEACGSPPGSSRANFVRRRSSSMDWASLCCFRGKDISAKRPCVIQGGRGLDTDRGRPAV